MSKVNSLDSALKNSSFNQLIGIEVDEGDSNNPVFSIIINEQHKNPVGIMHGGVALTIADVAGGYYIHDETDDFFVTLNQEYHFLAPVHVGDRLYTDVSIISSGYKIRVAQVDLYVEDKKVGHATITYYRSKLNK